MSRYWELLKDPRWQRKRLEVLERDGWTCQSCGRKDKTLHVHHSYYEKGNAPWEYPNESLKTLCEDCHSNVGLKQVELARAIALLEPGEIDQVIGYVRALRAKWYDQDDAGVEVVYRDCPVHNAEQVEGAMDAFGIPVVWERRYLDQKREVMNTARMVEDRETIRKLLWEELPKVFGKVEL